MIIPAFISKRNSPSVKSVMGIVSITKIGLTMVFRKARASATINAEI